MNLLNYKYREDRVKKLSIVNIKLTLFLIFVATIPVWMNYAFGLPIEYKAHGFVGWSGIAFFMWATLDSSRYGGLGHKRKGASWFTNSMDAIFMLLTMAIGFTSIFYAVFCFIPIEAMPLFWENVFPLYLLLFGMDVIIFFFYIIWYQVPEGDGYVYYCGTLLPAGHNYLLTQILNLQVRKVDKELEVEVEIKDVDLQDGSISWILINGMIDLMFLDGSVKEIAFDESEILTSVEKELTTLVKAHSPKQTLSELIQMIQASRKISSGKFDVRFEGMSTIKIHGVEHTAQ